MSDKDQDQGQATTDFWDRLETETLHVGKPKRSKALQRFEWNEAARRNQAKLEAAHNAGEIDLRDGDYEAYEKILRNSD